MFLRSWGKPNLNSLGSSQRQARIKLSKSVVPTNVRRSVVYEILCWSMNQSVLRWSVGCFGRSATIASELLGYFDVFCMFVLAVGWDVLCFDQQFDNCFSWTLMCLCQQRMVHHSSTHFT